MIPVLRALLASAIAMAAVSSPAAEGVAFITNLKGEVAIDGAQRPLLMGELVKGQKIEVGRDSLLSVMYIKSGKEYVLKGLGDYTVGEQEVFAKSGMPPAARETAWRPSSEVLVEVAKTSTASIRMRSLAPVKSHVKPKLEFPTDGAVATLQPKLRWTTPAAKLPFVVAIAVAGKDDSTLASAEVYGTSHRFPAKLQPDTEYSWSVSAGGHEIGSARFRTLPAAVLDEIQRRRPIEESDFSDRLMYALFLQQSGAKQEAQEAWGRLARERTDLPELASLAQ